MLEIPKLVEGTIAAFRLKSGVVADLSVQQHFRRGRPKGAQQQSVDRLSVADWTGTLNRGEDVERDMDVVDGSRLRALAANVAGLREAIGYRRARPTRLDSGFAGFGERLGAEEKGDAGQ